MTALRNYVAELRGVDVRTFDPPVDIAEKADEALLTTPEAVTSWLDKSCEGARQPVKVSGRDTYGKSIPQLVSMWMHGDNAQVIAATHALRERYLVEFSAEHRDEVQRLLVVHGLATQEAA